MYTVYIHKFFYIASKIIWFYCYFYDPSLAILKIWFIYLQEFFLNNLYEEERKLADPKIVSIVHKFCPKDRAQDGCKVNREFGFARTYWGILYYFKHSAHDGQCIISLWSSNIVQLQTGHVIKMRPEDGAFSFLWCITPQLLFVDLG